MSVSLQRGRGRGSKLGEQVTLDVRSAEEVLASAVARLERATDWFERSLSKQADKPW